MTTTAPPSRPAALAAVLLALGAAGCPLPQPVPSVARVVDGGTISIPIILAKTAVPADTVVLVRRDCAEPQFTLAATAEDTDTDEPVEARWFIDYGGLGGVAPQWVDAVLPSGDPNDPTRPLTAHVFNPYVFDRGARPALHVVEVVISNNFYATTDPTAPPPINRSAPAPYETQVYRWIFQYDDAGRCQ